MLLTNVKYKKRPMQCYCGTKCTNTSSMVDIHDGQDQMEESVSTCCLSKPTMNAVTQRTSFGNYGSTAIIESLPEITETTQVW